MFMYWYSKKCTRQTKFIVTILTCVLILLLQAVIELAPLWVIISTLMGIVMYIYMHFHTKLKLPYWCIWLIPILFFVLFYTLTHNTSIFLFGQIILFCFLGFSLASIYANKQPRNSSE